MSSSKDKDPKNLQQQSFQKNIIKLQTGFQFKSDIIGVQIFKLITDSFILPTYLQRYYQQIDLQNKRKKIQQDSKRENEGKLKYEIIDYRSFKMDSEGKINFLIKDKEYFQQLEKISEQNKINLEGNVLKLDKQLQTKTENQVSEKEKKVRQGQKVYKKSIISDKLAIFAQYLEYITAWKEGLLVLNNFFKDSNSKNQLQRQLRNIISEELKEQKFIKVIMFHQIKQQEQKKNYKKKRWSLLIRGQEDIIKIDYKGKPDYQADIKCQGQDSKFKQVKKVQESRKQIDFIIQFETDHSNNKENNDKEELVCKNSLSQKFQPNIKKFEIQFKAKSIQVTKKGFLEIDYNNYQDAKVKLIKFDIKGANQYLNYFIKKDRVFIDCQVIEYKQAKNHLSYYYKGFKFRKCKIFGEKHYNLAFQGGGAKGLAYVGAYKAIQQNKGQGKNQKSIKIKGIMGSSAGGIIAIAASTGISYREIQNFCYKMRTITKDDRITQADQIATDQFGNTITFKKIQQKLKELFHGFGFLNQSTFDQISKALKQKITEAEKDIINYLRIVNPNIVNILEDSTNVTKQQGWLWWKKTVKTEEKKPSINWSGILLHGALMKGNAIHNIAAECLMKFFINKSYEYNFEQKFLDESFGNGEQYSKRINTENIIELIYRYKEYQKIILQTSFQSIWSQHFETSKDYNQFVIFVINRTMVLINEFLEDQKQQQRKSLSLNNIQLFNMLQYSQRFINNLNDLSLALKTIRKKKQNNFQKIRNYSFHSFQMKKSLEIQQQFYKRIQRLEQYVIYGRNEGEDRVNEGEDEKKTMIYYFKIQWIFKLIKWQTEKDSKEEQFNQIITEQTIRAIKNVSQILQCKTYNQIASHTSMVALLNHQHFYPTKKCQKLTIYGFLKKMFNQQGNFFPSSMQDTIMNKLGEQAQKNNIKKQERQKQIHFLFQLANDIYTYLQSTKNPIQERKNVVDDLIQEMSKITLSQYYEINPIQITFTSVDLDNKILRLFNHLTTPNLPICKAVQMTGSFPIAFKAQRWQKQWGYYYLYHQNKKVIVDITGHEFTDGGLLANFPIKYFDNQTIRKCYFAHAHEKQNSIMLGFGLDQLKSGSYQKTKKEIQEEYQKNAQKQLALKKITDHFTTWFKIKEGFLTFFKSRWLNFGQQVQEWGSFNFKLIDEIPILRFITKILSAYPNADRNLSLEAFPEQIMIQQTDLNSNSISETIMMNNQPQKKKQVKKKEQNEWAIKKCFNQYKIFKKIIKQRKNPIKQQKAQKNHWFRLQKFIDNAQKNEIQIIKCINHGYKLLLQKFLLQPKHNPSTQINEKQMSLLLIQMLLITLKTNKPGSSNHIIKQVLSYRYIYFSFIIGQKKDQQYNIPLDHQIKDVKYKFNKKNLLNFIKNNNIKAIEKRLDFWDIRQIIIESLEDKQNNSKDKQIQKQKIYKNILNEYLEGHQQSQLIDFLLIDITQTTKRMIKYLYLQIKQKNIMKMKKFQTQIQEKNLDLQFKQDIFQNYKNVAFINSYQENNYETLIDPSCPNYLKFDQIFDFMVQLKQTGVTAGNKKHFIEYQWQFQQYLFNLKQNQDNQFHQKIKFSLDIFTKNIEERTQNCLKEYLKYQSFNKQSKELQRLLMVQKMLEKKYEYFCQDILLLEQINHMAIQNLTYNQTVSDMLKKILGTDQVGRFANFLLNKLQFRNRTDLSIQNQIHIRNLQYQAKKSLKNLVFGQKLQHQKKIRDRMKIYKKKLYQSSKKQHQNEGIYKDKKYVKNSKMQYELLQFLNFRMIYGFINNKYQKTKERKEFCDYHNAYIQDLLYFFGFVMELILLLLDYNQSNGQNNNDKQSFSDELFQKFSKIFSQFMKKYKKLSQMPQNLINLQALNQVFLIKYANLANIMKVIKNIAHMKNKNINKIEHISQTIIKFNNYKCCLPLFAQDWQQLVKVNHIIFYTKYAKLDYQKHKDNKYKQIIFSIIQYNRNTKILKRNIIAIEKLKNKEKPKQSETIFSKQTVSEKICQQQKQNYLKIKEEQNDYKGDTHLIIEGVCDSSAFCAYYYQIQNSSLNEQEKDTNGHKNNNKNFQIGMITSQMFGFFMCLGQDIDQIRSDLYKTRNYLFEMFNREKILQSYQLQEPCISLNYNSLIESYKSELFNAFKIFGKQYQKEKGIIDYTKQFSDIRLLIQQEQQYYIETCNQILDKAAQQIKNIENNFLQSQQPNQIAKAFGYDYVCSFGKRHEYSKYNKKCKQIYHKIITQFYEQFGSIISAILCNGVTNKIAFIINENQVENFTKGFLIARLMTVYKLKAFIFSKLEQNGFPFGITLNQFYKRCNQKIILNFVVVNLTDKRIDFLNQFTSPNMPVWAAIIAASTLPNIHRCFQSEKHWQDLQDQPFQTNQMLEFFQQNQQFKRKYTLYNSSMYISSIPMQLLANNTFFNRYEQLSHHQASGLKKLKRIGFAFNRTFSTNLLHMKIQKSYFNLSIQLIISALKISFSHKEFILSPIFSENQHKKRHYNKNYQVKYSPVTQIKDLLTNNNLSIMTLSTIIKSNDNLIMKWYSNRLIRLPIKLATLDFNKAIDYDIYNKFKIQFPSQHTREAILRSQEITKTFIHNIHNRFKYNKQQYYKNHSQSEKQRFLVKLRAEIVKIPSKFSDFSQNYMKITFLNHSKWNQNLYNNFIIQYKLKNLREQQFQFQRCENSQIVWRTQLSSKLILRFYYLHYQQYIYQPYKTWLDQDYVSSKNSRIMFSQFTLDFINIFKERPIKNSYDYKFIYAWNQSQEKKNVKQILNKYQIQQASLQAKLKQTKLNEIKIGIRPTKLNEIRIDSQKLKLPQLLIKNEYTDSKRTYSQKYIKRSCYILKQPCQHCKSCQAYKSCTQCPSCQL